MRIALLGVYPLRLFAERLGLRRPPQNTTSWNVNLAKGLVSIPGNEVHFITISSSLPKDQTITSDGLILHFLSAPPKARLLTLFQYNKIKIHRKLGQICPDIVHGQGTEHEYPYIAATSGYPFTITIHWVLSEALRGSWLKFGRRMRFKFLQCFEGIALEKAHSLIVTTEQMIPIYSQRFPDKEWFVINNSVAPLFFSPKLPQKARDGFLYVGRISPEKDILTLLRAFAEVAKRAERVNLHLVGAIEDKGYYNQIKGFIKDSGLENRVFYKGLKSQEEVARMMASSIAVVLVSQCEPFGLVLAEAMATGTPVIATRVGGIPYVVKDGETGFLVEPGDVEALGERMLFLWRERKLGEEMGHRGRDEAQQRFQSEVAARETMRVYQKVLNEKR